MQKSCSIKWIKLLPHFCYKFGKICRDKFRVQPVIKTSLDIVIFLQDVFQNFDLIKFNAAKILQYKVTHILIKFYYRIIKFDNRMHMFKHLLKRLRRLIKKWTKNGRKLLSTTFAAKMWVGCCLKTGSL